MANKNKFIFASMSPIRQVTHVIFDVDGLLLDSERLYTRCFQRIFAEYGKGFPLAFKARLMGLSATKSASLCVSEFDIPVTAEVFLQQMLTEQLIEFPNTELMPGARELVEHLHAVRVPMGVATSSKKATFAVKTGHHQDVFSKMMVTVNGDDPAVKEAKPAPDIFLEAAKRMNVHPTACLAFEDSPNGVRAALAAGMRVIWIPDTSLDFFSDHADLYNDENVHRYTSLKEVDLALFGLPHRE